MFSARWLAAKEAQAFGLVNYVVPLEELRSIALAYCEPLMQKNSESLAAMKALSLANWRGI